MTDQTEHTSEAVRLNTFVFDWFNERFPKEMNDCLDAYEAAKATAK